MNITDNPHKHKYFLAKKWIRNFPDFLNKLHIYVHWKTEKSVFPGVGKNIN